MMFIKVKAYTSSKKEQIIKKSDNSYVIYLKEPAQFNLANNRICEIIAITYSVNRKLVRIISGHHHSSKILSINL